MNYFQNEKRDNQDQSFSLKNMVDKFIKGKKTSQQNFLSFNRGGDHKLDIEVNKKLNRSIEVVKGKKFFKSLSIDRKSRDFGSEP